MKELKMNELIESLSHIRQGYGHWLIAISDWQTGEKWTKVTTNSTAIDAAFDDCYDDADNSDRIYECQRDAQEALVMEIARYYRDELEITEE